MTNVTQYHKSIRISSVLLWRVIFSDHRLYGVRIIRMESFWWNFACIAQYLPFAHISSRCIITIAFPFLMKPFFASKCPVTSVQTSRCAVGLMSELATAGGHTISTRYMMCLSSVINVHNSSTLSVSITTHISASSHTFSSLELEGY